MNGGKYENSVWICLCLRLGLRDTWMILLFKEYGCSGNWIVSRIDDGALDACAVRWLLRKSRRAWCYHKGYQVQEQVTEMAVVPGWRGAR